LKATRPLLAAGKWVSRALPSSERTDDDQPLIPAEDIKSSYVENPENDGVDGQRVGQGVHAIPLGREVRLAYEVDPGAGTFDVRRRAYFDGEELGEAKVETIEYDPERREVQSPYRDIPDADPETYAQQHFRRAGAELIDGFAECLQPWQKPKDYPLNPTAR
jgi:hypothetical protein